jgi:hypothetical protein
MPDPGTSCTASPQGSSTTLRLAPRARFRRRCRLHSGFFWAHAPGPAAVASVSAAGTGREALIVSLSLRAVGFRCLPSAFEALCELEMDEKLKKDQCPRSDQCGVRAPAGGDGEAEGKGELLGDAEEKGDAGGDAVGPVVAGTVVSAVVCLGLVGGSVLSRDVVSALVVSSMTVFSTTIVSSGVMGFVRSACG